MAGEFGQARLMSHQCTTEDSWANDLVVACSWAVAGPGDHSLMLQPGPECAEQGTPMRPGEVPAMALAHTFVCPAVCLHPSRTKRMNGFATTRSLAQ